MEVSGKRTDFYDEEENLDNIVKPCQPCGGDNVYTPASGFCNECEEYMCNTCFRQHIRVKLCKHHTLLDINSSTETCLRSTARATKCKEHDGETIKFYCRKHEAVGCGDCMVLGHNACNSEYIKDLSENFKQSEEYQTSIKQIENLISETQRFEKKIHENKNDNKLMLEKAIADIKQFRLDINEHLDKAEADFIKRASDVMEENETLLTRLEKACQLLSTKLENNTDMLNAEIYKDNVLFVHIVECKPKLSESEIAISDMVKKFKFDCNQQQRSLVTSKQKLGTLAISTSAVFQQTAVLKDDTNKSKISTKENIITMKNTNTRENIVRIPTKKNEAMKSRKSMI